MRLTRFSDLGLRALMRMAAEPARAISTADLAAEFAISRNHLTKAMAALSASGVVTTRRGTGGGALLARPADQIRVGDVVAALERDSALVECFQTDGGACSITTCCRLKPMLGGARQAFIDHLNRFTLADCALPPREAHPHVHNL